MVGWAFRFVFLVGLVSAFSLTPNNGSNKVPAKVSTDNKVAATAAAIGLSVILSTAEPALASNTAAQISLDTLPPTTVSVQIGDLPVVGSLLSGTYTRVDAKTVTGKPSVVIKSPKDKIGAIKNAATGGHLEFDVSGIIATHMDVDVGAPEAGVAKVRVASKLIPKLPFKNAATMADAPSGKKTAWNVVTNMGTGDSYYYNEDTGVSQTEKPTI